MINLLPNQFERLACAAEILRTGGLVAFPTETVYGLGAICTNEQALLKIFAAKGRPGDNPLIVHIWHETQLKELVTEINPKAASLISEFWPGPLTLIFPKLAQVSQVVTAGLETVAVRMPRHPIAQELLRLTGIPVAAPSANLSGRPSPTRGSHVVDDLFGKVNLIIEAGYCEAGIESTVLSLASEQPVILRPGSVTKEMIEAVLGETVALAEADAERPQAPGMKYQHYAPQAPAVLFEGSQAAVVKEINRLLIKQAPSKKIVVMASTENLKAYHHEWVLDLGHQTIPEEAGVRLYDLLRFCDQLAAEQIYIEGVAAVGVGLAVANRLRKAVGGNVVKVD